MLKYVRSCLIDHLRKKERSFDSLLFKSHFWKRKFMKILNHNQEFSFLIKSIDFLGLNAKTFCFCINFDSKKELFRNNINLQTLILLFLSLIVLTHCEIITINPQSDSAPSVSLTANTYVFKTKMELDTLRVNSQFLILVAKIKKFWQNTMSEILGEVIAVEEQVVSGINRRITFEVKTGHIVKKVVITVLLQPWASIMRVTSTLPWIPGGIGQGDETNMVFPGEQLTVRSENLVTSIRTAVPISGSVLQRRKQISNTIQPTRTTSTATTSTASTSVRSDPVFISMRPVTVSTVKSVSFA